MTLTQLARFVRSAELGSLTKAAASLRIAQPALSRQIHHLEIELGSALLIRHAGGVTLTAAGETLLERARQLLRDADAVRDSVLALAAEPTGRVAVGVPSSIATALLPPLAEQLRTQYPKLRPYFVDGFSAVLHARTLAGELDLAILYDDRALGPLSTLPLLRENLMLVGARDTALNPNVTAFQALSEHPIILPARPNRLRLIVDDAFDQHQLSEQTIYEVDSLPAIVAMVAQGAGLTVLPFSAVSPEVANGALQVWPLSGPILSRTLLLVRPLGREPMAAVAVLEAEIRRVVADLAHSRRWLPLT